MNKETIKHWAAKLIIRDMNLEKNSFIYLFLSLFAITLIAEVYVYKYIVLMEIGIAADIERILLLFIFSISFLVSGLFIDVVKNKTRFYNISLLICIFGLFLNTFYDNLFNFIGLLILLIIIPQLFLLWCSTLVHETNILNRSRVSALLIISCFLLGLIGIAFAIFDFLYKILFIVEFFLLISIVWRTRTYKYIETKERLKSDKIYLKLIFEKHFIRYSVGFTILSATLGIILEQFGFDIDIIIFSIVSFLYLIAAGCVFDYMGRKSALFYGILIVSFFLISYGSFIGEDILFIYGLPRKIYLSIHYAFSILPLLLAIITISGDFSTERGNLKYRGRINGIFMSLFLLGIIIGFLISRGTSELYEANPDLNRIMPDFPSYLGAFALVILIVWIASMASMKELLVSKEIQWASTIKNLFVSNYSGICLYFHDFEQIEQPKEKIDQHQVDEDLIAGGLSGVITIISEITKSKKRLRIIEKEGVQLIFSYGKYHIATLISTMNLPILLKKLDEFSREFEEKFEKELKSFTGYINPFESTKYLVDKYFIQKYAIFME